MYTALVTRLKKQHLNHEIDLFTTLSKSRPTTWNCTAL